MRCGLLLPGTGCWGIRKGELRNFEIYPTLRTRHVPAGT
jgi:hypothetical protein